MSSLHADWLRQPPKELSKEAEPLCIPLRPLNDCAYALSASVSATAAMQLEHVGIGVLRRGFERASVVVLVPICSVFVSKHCSSRAAQNQGIRDGYTQS